MPAPGLDLAREYDVSAFVPAFASTLAAWGERARTVRNDLPGHYNLAYGPGAAEQLDLFCADTGPHAAPLLVFLHGGFWRRLHKDDFTWAAPAYVQRGVSVAIVNYGLAPATTLDTIVDQTRRAIACRRGWWRAASRCRRWPTSRRWRTCPSCTATSISRRNASPP
jgi:arylformamidase